MVMFDTNMILRYLLDDNKEMAEKAEQYLNTRNVSVTPEIIAEVVYVLKGVYSLKRSMVTDTIKKFMELVNCQEHDIVILALETFSNKNLDFVDCVLYAYHKLQNIEIATFDKKLKKLIFND